MTDKERILLAIVTRIIPKLMYGSIRKDKEEVCESYIFKLSELRKGDLVFANTTIRINELVLDKRTQSHEWFMAALVEKIVIVEGNQRRLVYYDGKKQRGLINEMYFDEDLHFPARAFELLN